MTLLKTKVHHPLGVEIQLPQTRDEWDQVPSLLHEHSVLVISDLNVTATELEDNMLQPLASALGHQLLPYERWPGQSPAVTKHLALLGNYKARADNDIVPGATVGQPIAEYKPATLEVDEWHTDGSFLAVPKSYICLYAPAVVSGAGGALPPQGGETRFCSTRVPSKTTTGTATADTASSTAPKHQKLLRSEDDYQGWTTVHSWESFMRFLEARDPKRPKVTASDCAAKPDQTWPLVVRRHNNNGRWHYYLNPKNTKAVYDGHGRAVENPTRFVHDLAGALMDVHGVYWHKWKAGQVVVWDNQAVLHAATPFDATRYERLLYRAELVPHHVKCTPHTVKWGYLETAPPVVTVASGAIVVVDTVTGSPQLPPAAMSFRKIPPELADIQARVHERVGPHILTGPIALQDAAPGDVLQVDILDVRIRTDWAWTKHKASGQVRHTRITSNGCFAETEWGSRVECDPFFGVLGVATAERVHSIPPSATYGGNLDLKRLTAGSTLYIPVHVAGALLYVGDGHARQGDGECCGTALETSLTGTFRLSLLKRKKKDDPPLLRSVRAETATELIGIGVEDSVDAAVASALANLVEWMQELSPGLSKVDAECLCSIAADIAVTQIVNGTTRGAHVTLQKKHLPPSTP